MPLATAASDEREKNAKVWVVTGCSGGIGLEIARAILAAGDRLVATSRRVSDLSPLVTLGGDAVLPLALDLTDVELIARVVPQCIAKFGRIDAIVNNAALRVDGAAEEQSDNQVFEQLNVNLLGAIRLTIATLPHMRAQRSGRIVQISSMIGQMPAVGFSLYAASKWGLEGFTESLAEEVIPLGIYPIIVELGSFRTERRGVVKLPCAIPDYEGTAGKASATRTAKGGRQPGDPARAAATIVALSTLTAPPLRVPLGSDAFSSVSAAMKRRLNEFMKFEASSRQTDFNTQIATEVDPSNGRVRQGGR